MFDYEKIFEKVRNRMNGRVPVWLTNSPQLKKDVERLRDALVEGLSDAVSLPEVSSDNARAAHDLLGCERFHGLVMIMSKVSQMGDERAQAALRQVAVDAVQGMAYRLITEGWQCFNDHQKQDR